MSMIATGVMAVVSIASNISAQRAAAKAADKRREAEARGAMMQYATAENAANIMKRANLEASYNATYEVMRAGAAQNQDVRDAVQKAESSVLASKEGLTSGRSQGRQMVSLQVKGNEALQKSKSQASTMISQITDAQDKATNDLNNKLFANYSSLVATLTNPGAVYQGSNMSIVASGVTGAAQGASMGSSFNMYS